jgi:glycosyltransferase involved in cell wall biosynthesis
MRILHIISSLSAGGAEVYVRDLSTRMVHEGHDVCIAYISSAKEVNRCVEYETSFKRTLTEAGICFFEIGHKCRRWQWKGGASLSRILEKFKPDVIHSHLYYGLFFKALSLTSIPLVYTHHNQRLGKGRFLYPFFNKIVDRYVGISIECTKALETVTSINVANIYNGVNIGRLKVKCEYDYHKTNLEALAIGTLGEQKNFRLLICACNDLLVRRNDLTDRFMLKIAGEGPQKKELHALINRLNLTANIKLLGNRQDVPQLLHGSDVFIMSSSWEGLPISLLEAMMTGLSVIVTDVGGCREVVESCFAGIVVPPQNIQALSEALEELIVDVEKRTVMGIRAKKNAQRFTIDHACEQHLDLYQALLSEKKYQKF